MMWLNSHKFKSDFHTRWPRKLDQVKNRTVRYTTIIFSLNVLVGWFFAIDRNTTIGLQIMVLGPCWAFFAMDYAHVLLGRALYLQCLRNAKLQFQEEFFRKYISSYSQPYPNPNPNPNPLI